MVGGQRWPKPRSFAGPPERDQVPILQEAEWAPEPVWMDAESCIHRVRIEERPAPSESLHRLRYPVPPKSGRASVKFFGIPAEIRKGKFQNKSWTCSLIQSACSPLSYGLSSLLKCERSAN